MGQDLAQLLSKLILTQKVRPDNQAVAGDQLLIGKANPNVDAAFFVSIWSRTVGAPPSRPGILIWFQHRKPAKRCSLFQAESFRHRSGEMGRGGRWPM